MTTRTLLRSALNLVRLKGFAPTPEVLRTGHPLLRIPADDVSKVDLTSPRFLKTVDTMKRVFDGTPNLLGLSAPQIGQSIKLFAIQITDAKLIRDKKVDAAMPLTFYVNPKLTILDRDQKSKWAAEYESCESIPNYNALVRRAQLVRLDAWDLQGNLNGLFCWNVLILGSRVREGMQEEEEGMWCSMEVAEVKHVVKLLVALS
ncbi:hypothetical protein SmJEL517_g06143 [Synchytrium microbalum]|uniref:Peptide deformylase n=1 Tax=Synchytrium microbalum TaxID=1806994 RepID=A0A507BYA2_9FUNG|nr:uncharacterized protein SmJEL517_g06143 [Synchytrium microbalum]TPX30253.1 hypothetical protein SmJEL517_g06143 [Synchytrium microbalum]